MENWTSAIPPTIMDRPLTLISGELTIKPPGILDGGILETSSTPIDGQAPCGLICGG